MRSALQDWREQEGIGETAGESAGAVRALERGLQIISCFDMRRPAWRIADLAKEVGLHRATARRLIKTLEAASFLDLDPESGEYRLGSALFPIAYVLRAHDTIVRVTHPFLERLSADTGESVGLSVWANDGMLHLDHVQTRHLFKPQLVPGAVSNVYGTSHSKILLAFGPEERLSRLSFGDRGSSLSLAEITRVQTELQNVRDSGIAWDIEGSSKGVGAVGVPIRDGSGEVIASLSVVAPIDRFGPTQQELTEPLIRATGFAISKELGFRG